MTLTPLVVVFMLTAWQRSLIYHPFRSADLNPPKQNLPATMIEAVSVTTHDKLSLNGWHIVPKPRFRVGDNPAAPKQSLPGTGKTVLFFCGNGGNRSFRTEEFDLLTRLGCDVYCFDYRGYGDNPGAPAEKDIALDVRSEWDFLVTQQKLRPDQIVLYGESLGGGVAVRLAAEVSEEKQPPAGLILRSTFTSLVDAARNHFPWLPVKLLLVDRFPSDKRIPQVTCPILIAHGTRDTIVPFALGQQLFKAAPRESLNKIPKTFVELPTADHNDVLMMEGPAFRDAVSKFLTAIK